jgi:cyclophilin family peptidyl-prolyl cis-trans isomerase
MKMRIGRLLALLFALATPLGVAPLFAQAPAVAPAPAPAPDPANVLNLDLSTGGRVSILLRPDKAPLSVARIKALVARGFYNGLTFHRVIDGFMAQGGDPKGDGSGGSDLPDLKAEFNDLPHVRGVMAMARAQSPDSANSQFFIMLSPNLQLDYKYTAIGRVIGGMGYVDLIEKGEPPTNPSKIVRASFASDNVPPPPPSAANAAAASSAAAGAATAQSVDAAMAAESAARAANAGDRATATERANAARVSADGAARAASDAAEALATPPAKPPVRAAKRAKAPAKP